MMVLPFQISPTHYSVFIVLGGDSLERIQQYDPAEVTINKLGEPYAHLQLKDVLVGYATEAEMQGIINLGTAGEVQKVFRMLTRGFRFRPGQGDYDGPYLDVKKGNKGPKH